MLAVAAASLASTALTLACSDRAAATDAAPAVLSYLSGRFEEAARRRREMCKESKT